jgi:hypothetical protein
VLKHLARWRTRRSFWNWGIFLHLYLALSSQI